MTQRESLALIAALGQVAQSVEQWTENPRVGGSIPPLATTSVAADVATEGTTVGMVLTVTSLAAMQDLLKDNPPSALNKINKEKLQAMAIPDPQIEAFLKNYNYSPTEKTLPVEALNRMGDVKGREVFIAHATAAPDKTVARWMQQRAEMMANYVNELGPGDIVDVGDDPLLLTRDGVVLAVVPTDYLAWSEELSQAAQRVAQDIAGRSDVKAQAIWSEGEVDPVARKAMEGRGWEVQEDVQLASRATGEDAQGRPGLSPAGMAATKVAP